MVFKASTKIFSKLKQVIEHTYLPFISFNGRLLCVTGLGITTVDRWKPVATEKSVRKILSRKPGRNEHRMKEKYLSQKS